MNRIVFFRTDMLGDTLLNLPVLDELKRVFPHVSITLVCHPSLIGLLETYPSVDDFIPFEAGRRKAGWKELQSLLRLIKKGRFDTAIISNARKDIHALTFLSGIRVRIGYDRKWGFLLTHRIKDEKKEACKHEIEYNLRLLEPLKVGTTKVRFALPVHPKDKEALELLLKEQGILKTERIVLIHPFSSDPRKCWPLAEFAELMCFVRRDFDVKMLVIGLEAEREAAEELVANTGGRAFNFSGRTDLRMLCALIQRASLLVGHDSGPMHIASAVGTPTVSLFARFSGGANPVRWRPWGENHQVIYEDLENLSSEQVYKEVQKKLSYELAR